MTPIGSGLRRRRREQLEHAGTAMSRELTMEGDIMHRCASALSRELDELLAAPFPNWRRVHQVAGELLDLAEQDHSIGGRS